MDRVDESFGELANLIGMSFDEIHRRRQVTPRTIGIARTVMT